MNKNTRQKIKIINTETMEFEVLETLNKGEKIRFTNEETDIFTALSNEIEKSKQEILEKLKEDQKIIIINEFKANDKEYKTLQASRVELETFLKNKAEEAKNNKLLGVKEYKESKEFLEMEKNIETLKSKLNKTESDLSVMQEREKISKEAIISAFKESIEYKKLQNEIRNKETEITKLTEQNKLAATTAVNNYRLSEEFKKEYTDVINNKDLEINNLRNELEKKDREKADAVHEKEKELEAFKSRNRWTSTKAMGQEFEDWFKNQFERQFSFNERIVLKPVTKSKKDSSDEKATKGDFLLEIFENDNRKPDELLLNVLFELKTQDDHSENKKKNKDHIDKLDKDRKKEKAQFAILVSELEPEDDFIFKKVKEHDDMYIIRPAYVVPFIDVLMYLAKKELQVRQIGLQSFKEKEQIENDIKDFKNKADDLLAKTSNDFINISKYCDSIDETTKKIKSIVTANINLRFEKIKTALDKISLLNYKK
ncbi:DUF2130 domain-containing protein [Ureaplasma diversum]|uniref:DUF2130 domain-containing protein n=1 Tax=Ureaplasma diversum NCTC 246 TaxID=1188241 RepID=A0A084EWG0_9BACT|nr:DUF2130 domain-containing protein [Ureaplasma diversum]KEZ22302.1 Hypothetical protein, DUF2130 family [Ureaplasma diversum NCTC 246]